MPLLSVLVVPFTLILFPHAVLLCGDGASEDVDACEVLLLLTSPTLLQHPTCLLALHDAVRKGVPLLRVSLAGTQAGTNTFSTSLHQLTHLDLRPQHLLPPGPGKLLSAGLQLQDLARVLSAALSQVSAAPLPTA